jgi:hypothetical protein
MKIFDKRWLIIVGLAAIGCGSSSGTKDSGVDGHGGSGGSAGHDAGPALNLYLFNTDKQGWDFSNYADPNNLNLAGLYPIDGGAGDAGLPDAGAATAPSLTWDGTVDSEGSTSSGSLKVAVTFTGYHQIVDPQIGTISPTIDLTGKIIHVKVLVDNPLPPTYGVQLHVSGSGSMYVYVSQFYNSATFTVGQWQDIVLDPSTATPPQGKTFDPSQVIQIGVQLGIYDPPTTDAGAPPFPVDAVFHIDTVTAK